MNKRHEIYSSLINSGIIKNDSYRLFRFLTGLFFRRIELDEESLLIMNEYRDKGKFVFASMQSKSTALFILLNLLKKHNFPVPELALGFIPYSYQKLRILFVNIMAFCRKYFTSKDQEFISNADYIERTLKKSGTLALSLLSRKLFLRRYVQSKADSIEYLLEVQKDMEEPVFLFPQVIFWNRNPEKNRSILRSSATGDRGLLSGYFVIFKSVTPAFLRIGKPLNLKEELEASPTDDINHIARNIRNKILDTYNYEKRSILGPQIKTQQEMMERVLYHKNVLDTIQSEMDEKKVSEKKLRRKAYSYYREIAADFSIIYIRFFTATNDYLFRKIFDGMHYDVEDFKRLREASQKGPLILIPSHKSHMDYIIISSLFYHNKFIPPHILAGSNLTFFPMGKIFRRSGAFFMRRTFKGLNLYAAVFKQYVKTLVNEGYTIEFFIEGGRSRTGKVVSPKMGMLKYLIEAVDEGYNKDLVFVPMTVNYDRILEENSYKKELKGSEKKKESTSGFIKSRKLISRKYGTVYLAINEPFTLSDARKKINSEKQINSIDELTSEVGYHIVKEINKTVMVTPFALVTAAILYTTTRGFSREIIKARMEMLLSYMKEVNARLTAPLYDDENIDEIISTVFESYMDDRIIAQVDIEPGKAKKDHTEDDLYIINDEERARINFYKNSMIHVTLPVNMICLAILGAAGGAAKVTKNKVIAEFERIRGLFSKEFVYDDSLYNSEDVYNETVKYLESRGMVSLTQKEVTLIPEKKECIRFFAGMIQDYIEGMFIVLSTVNDFSDKSVISRKDFIVDVRKKGIKLYHLGEIECSESLSMVNYNNSIDRLHEEGITIIKSDGKNQELSINSGDSFKDIMANVSGYLSIVKNG
jgi:glycerol-3-phosphate O-acyltransferase